VIREPGQYSTDENLRARQRLWLHQEPPFDLLRWAVGLTGAGVGSRVLDVGCGNGVYLARLRTLGANVTGCDLSAGMLSAVSGPGLVNADAQLLPYRDAAVDVVLAAHMLYHVPDQRVAVAEMRRVLVPGGRCVVVTNGAAHIASLRRLVESVVHESTPGWRMVDWATRTFSLDQGRGILQTGFDQVACLRPPITSRVVISDAAVVADYVASVADAYQDQVACPWPVIVEGTRNAVQAVIDRDGTFTTAGDSGAFICQ
jgi:SAM-dependent methyltransferase